MVWDPEFKGYIHDVGGPTANFRQPACKNNKNMELVQLNNVYGQNLVII